MARTAALLCAAAFAAGEGDEAYSTEAMNVETEWEEHMRCPACKMLAEELVFRTEDSYDVPNQEGMFKMKVEREDWVLERAVPTAGSEYAFIVHNKDARDQTRGKFHSIGKLLEKYSGDEAVVDGLEALRGDPIVSLQTYLGSLAYAFDEEISGFIHSKAGVEEVTQKLCYDLQDDEVGTICTPEKKKKKKKNKEKKKVKKRVSQLKDEL